MPLKTTTIGSYPKPDYTPISGWLANRGANRSQPTRTYSELLQQRQSNARELFDRATQEVVCEQVDIGIDVPTDGEIRREHYIYYHLRHVEGFDFDRLTTKTMRDGSWRAEVPTVVGPLAPRDAFLPRDWEVAQSVSKKPVKITLPGPMTIIDSIADDYYGEKVQLAMALAQSLNAEIRRLAEVGCQWIQVDEPLFARKPDDALAFGVEALARCFESVPDGVNRVVHVCCGYPSDVDLEDYPKADPAAYGSLADALEDAPVDVVSIEDAHRHNDLKLLERFQKTKIILGVIDIGRTRIESAEEVRARLAIALEHIDRDRLIAGPDCGLVMLDRDATRLKLENLVAAARSLD